MTAGPLISYYGDDFTGSTDVMEALSSNGVETVLFTRLPTDAERAALPLQGLLDIRQRAAARLDRAGDGNRT
jgi:uncharacterized protein YgbK (DUF1537 family)